MKFWIVLAIFGVSTACDDTHKNTATQPSTQTAKQAVASVGPSLPLQSSGFGPSLTTLSKAGPYDLDVHMEVKACAECHAVITEEWNDSVHALASMSNPFYRLAFDEFAQESGREKLPFCGGCHDPALLYDGSLSAPVDGTSERAHVGISCNTCHGIEAATADGNGSYTLNTTPIPVPKDGDAKSLSDHIARVGMAPLRTNELCVSCHRGFMTPETGHEVVISGIDDWGPFRGSAYNGNPTVRITDVEKTDCVGCHMPVMPDGHNSHRFPGGHSALAAMTSPGQLEAVKKLVENAATIDVPTFGVGTVKTKEWKGAKPLETLWFDVVVHNKNVGHVFPGGAQDLRDTWIEVELRDKNGNILASAGQAQEATGKDPSAYVLQAFMVDEAGERIDNHAVHSFRTPAFKHGISPKDSAVIRYTYTLPKGSEAPATVRAKLRHRRLTKSFQDATCEHTKRPEDQAFQQGALKFRGFKGDPCAPQPIIEIADTTIELENPTTATPEWIRQYQRGQGLAHHVSESLDEASSAFLETLKLLGPDGDPRSRAKTHFELGRVYGRQGRVQDAMDQYNHAEALVGEHAAIHFGRGDANHRAFRFNEAVKWYTAASKLVDDDRIWRELAIAAGSMVDSQTAYEAARRGLLIEPRDAHLLQNQLLALRELSTNKDWLDGAAAAFLEFKRDEQAPNIHNECASKSDECRSGRIPVPVIALQKPL